MAVELAEIAAGLPLAASFALAGGVSTLREGRRRSDLNEALHELRRPLQALALAAPAGDEAFERSLQIASAAVEKLEREINGEIHEVAPELVSLRPLVEAAAERWRRRAELESRSLRGFWSGPPMVVRGDRVGLTQALDNLISNGIEHGSGEVVVEGRAELDGALLVVRDGGAPRSLRAPVRPCSRRLWSRLDGRNRHGHGLRVVRRTAAALGGGFRLCRDEVGTAAILELPAFAEVEQ